MSLELRGVTKSFGATHVLKPLTLSAGAGELLALLGPSGCGKTTTLRILAGLLAPDAGRVIIGGADVTDLPPERRGLGMVFQHYAIWPHLRIDENVAYPLERAGVKRPERDERVREALQLVRLESLAGRRPHQLSGGQLQRVALARAIVGRPRVLLLDEPLSNLDAALREELRAEIRALQRRLAITTVLVTHDQSEALSMADRVAILNAGALEQVGAPADLYARPASAFVARFVGGGNVIDLPGKGVAVVRPEHVRLDPGGVEAKVVQRLYQGDRVELRLELAGQSVRAYAGAAEPIAEGDLVRVSFTESFPLPGSVKP